MYTVRAECGRQCVMHAVLPMFISAAGAVITGEQISIMSETQQHLEKVIARMQTIQRAIKSSGQPASRFELQELKDLGAEYAKIIESLETAPDNQSRN